MDFLTHAKGVSQEGFLGNEDGACSKGMAMDRALNSHSLIYLDLFPYLSQLTLHIFCQEAAFHTEDHRLEGIHTEGNSS